MVLAALSGIAKAWESPFNQSKFSAAPPLAQFSVGVNTPSYGEGNSKTAHIPPTAHTRLWASAARRPERAGGVRDQSRMAAIRHEARGAAREPDGGTPGRNTIKV